MIKAVYSKPIVNINLHGEHSKQMHQNKEQGKVFHSLYLFHIVPEMLARSVRQMKEIKELQVRKEVKVLFSNNMTLKIALGNFYS